MPLFMDYHKIDSDAFTEEDAYKGHLRDVAVQNKYGLTYKKYYLSLRHKTAFCLMEAPNIQACIDSHREAHGIGACNVIEVSPEHEFLPYIGNGAQNERDEALTTTGEIDTGFRTLLYLEVLPLTKSPLLDKSKIIQVLSECHGNLVRIPSSAYWASFLDAPDALNCALKIREYLNTFLSPLEYRLALATGQPVDETGTTIFQRTRKKALVLASLAPDGFISLDPETRLALKGHPELFDIAFPNLYVADRSQMIWLEKLDSLIRDNLRNASFSMDILNKDLGLSKSGAYRKIIALTERSPKKLLLEMRLHKALQTLTEGGKSISEIAYDMGYSSPSYFTRVFRKRYGILPTSVGKGT